jgi:hypothetical protein
MGAQIEVFIPKRRHDTQHNDTQHNYIQHKDTQHKIKVIATLCIMTLNAECRKQAHYAACLNAEYFL